MKILVLLTANTSIKNWYDYKILKRELSIYKKLSIQGYNFKFLSWGDESDKRYLPKGYNLEIINLFKKLYLNKSKLFRYIYSIYFIKKNITKFKDIEVIKSNQLIGSHLGLYIKFLIKKKFICRMGYEPNQFYENEKLSFKKIILLLYSKIVYNKCDLIVVTTNDIKNYIINKFKIHNKKIKVIPNYVDTNIFSAIKIKKKKFKNFVTISRLTNQKNLEYLFKEIARGKFKLDIIGSKKNLDSYKNLAKKLNANVNFVGPIKNNKLMNFYKKKDLFILLSRYEGNPKSLLEAMSCRMIVLASNVRGIKNIIQDNRNGFLINFKNGELVKKVNYLSQKKQLEKIRDNARKYIMDNHSLEKISLLEKKIYYQVKKL